MANRRMFSKEIVGSDAFLSMPLTAQALYFHLGMEADDDGFVASPQRTMRMLGNMPDDLNILVAKRFLIAFPNEGVVVIKHWRMNNLLKNDRYHETTYTEIAKKLVVKKNGSYSEDTTQGLPLMPISKQLEPKRNPNGTQMEPQVSIGKVSIGKNNKDKDLPVSATASKDDDMAEAEKIIAKYKGKAE